MVIYHGNRDIVHTVITCNLKPIDKKFTGAVYTFVTLLSVQLET